MLAGSEGHAAGARELSTTIGMSPEQTCDVLARLADGGIVEMAPASRTVRLSASPETLTLADVARAIGEWLLVLPSEDDAGPSVPGLCQALGLVQERSLEGLEQMRVPRVAAARW